MSTWQIFIVYYIWAVAIAAIAGPAINRALGDGNVFERVFLWLQRGVEAGLAVLTRRHAK